MKGRGSLRDGVFDCSVVGRLRGVANLNEGPI